MKGITDIKLKKGSMQSLIQFMFFTFLFLSTTWIQAKHIYKLIFCVRTSEINLFSLHV